MREYACTYQYIRMYIGACMQGWTNGRRDKLTDRWTDTTQMYQGSAFCLCCLLCVRIRIRVRVHHTRLVSGVTVIFGLPKISNTTVSDFFLIWCPVFWCLDDYRKLPPRFFSTFGVQCSGVPKTIKNSLSGTWSQPVATYHVGTL